MKSLNLVGGLEHVLFFHSGGNVIADVQVQADCPT
jgi:hypothetical protein